MKIILWSTDTHVLHCTQHLEMSAASCRDYVSVGVPLSAYQQWESKCSGGGILMRFSEETAVCQRGYIGFA